MSRFVKSLCLAALSIGLVTFGFDESAQADESDGDIDYFVYDRSLSWEPSSAPPGSPLYFHAALRIRCPASTDLINYRETYFDRSFFETQFDGTSFANQFQETGIALDEPTPLGPMVLTWICGRIIDDETYEPLAAANIDFTVVAQPPFWDMRPGAFYEPAVRRAVDSGLTGGVTPTTFEPNGTVNRWQMAVFLQRLARQLGDPAPGVTDQFADTTQLASSFRNAIGWMGTANVTKGCDLANNYCPYDGVTRAQMALFLQRFAKALGEDVGSAPDTFGDTAALPSDFKRAIGWLADSGVTQGCTSNSFCPNEVVSRWQMVVFLDRLETALKPA